jgi:hypothetical protein
MCCGQITVQLNLLALQVRAVWCWEYWTSTEVFTKKMQSTGGWFKSWFFCRVYLALTSSACMLNAHYGSMFFSCRWKRCPFNGTALCPLSIKGYTTWMNFNLFHYLLWYGHRSSHILNKTQDLLLVVSWHEKNWMCYSLL